MVKEMYVPSEVLRALVGLIGIGCAYLCGRTAVAVRKGWQKQSRLTGWILRAAVCLLAVGFRHPLDAPDGIVAALMAAAFAAGAWRMSHRPEPEDLTNQIFPDQP